MIENLFLCVSLFLSICLWKTVEGNPFHVRSTQWGTGRRESKKQITGTMSANHPSANVFNRTFIFLQVWIRVKVHLMCIGPRFLPWYLHGKINMRYTCSSSVFHVTPKNQWPEQNDFTSLKFKISFQMYATSINSPEKDLCGNNKTGAIYSYFTAEKWKSRKNQRFVKGHVPREWSCLWTQTLSVLILNAVHYCSIVE